MSEEHQAIVEQLEKFMAEGRTSDGIMSKKVDKKVLKIKKDRVNEAIKYLKSKYLREYLRALQKHTIELGQQKSERLRQE